MKKKKEDKYTHVLEHKLTGKISKAFKLDYMRNEYWEREDDPAFPVGKRDIKWIVPVGEYEFPHDPFIKFEDIEHLEDQYTNLGYVKYMKSSWENSEWEAYRVNSDKARAFIPYGNHFVKTWKDKFDSRGDDLWLKEDGYLFRINVAVWNELFVYIFEPNETAAIRRELLEELTA